MSGLSVGGTHGGAQRGPSLEVAFEMGNALTVSRNLGILASRLPMFQQRAVGTLRRRLATEGRRDIQREYNLTAGRIAKDLDVGITPGGLRITGFWRGIGLRQFNARDLRQSGRGVSASIFLGKRSLRPHAFFVRLNRGEKSAGGEGTSLNEHVAEREGAPRVMTSGRYRGKVRQPLVTQYGPTVAQMLAKGRRPERLADFARGVLRDDLERQIDGYTKGRPIPGADN